MPGQVLATSFVEPRGTIKSIVAGAIGRELGGGLTAATAAHGVEQDSAGASPLAKGQVGYLVAFDDQIVLYRAKRGAFKPKPSDEVLATAPRASVTGAELERKKLSGVLTVRFADASEWTFDVPKIYLSTAEGIAAALSA
jgi:hypothetical protein